MELFYEANRVPDFLKTKGRKAHFSKITADFDITHIMLTDLLTECRPVPGEELKGS